MQSTAEHPPSVERIRQAATHPVTVAILLTLVGSPLETQGGLDRSWKVGLALATAGDLPFGPGIAFTFGPLGFLAVPLDLYRPQLILGVLFTLVVAFTLYLAVMMFLRTWLRPTVAIVVAIAVMLIASRLPTAEMATAAFILWVLWFLRREAVGTSTPMWVFAVLGAASSLLVLVKFSAGVVGLAAVILALAAPKRFMRLATVIGSALIGLVGLWLAAGQRVGDLPQWVQRSIDVASGYTAAMSGQRTTWEYALLLLPLLAIMAIGSAEAIRLWGRGAVGFLLVVWLSCWLFLKESFVRFDVHHAPLILAFAALLICTFPWRRRPAIVGLSGIVGCLLVFVVNVGGGTPDVISSRLEASRELARVSRETIDDRYFERRRAEAANANGFPLDPAIVTALDGDAVHTDPGDMGTIYRNQLTWRPTPIFQTYSAYTPTLDEANAEFLTADDGPTAILYRSESIDGRNPRWESPDYQLAMACNFEVVATAGAWQALRRASPVCDDPIPISTVEVSAGEDFEVPAPSDPHSIVVARFRLTTSLAERLGTLLLRPIRQPHVSVDGESFLFVPGTARGQHVLRQPAEIDGRQLPIGAIDYRTLRFDNVESPVTAEFYEVPLDSTSHP